MKSPEEIFKSVYMLLPLSTEAKEWVNQHIEYESWQVMDDAIAIEHRYIRDIVEALKEEGFESERDFTVY